MHSGFNVHRSRRVLPKEREDLQRLAQYTRLLRYARLREQAQHCGQVMAYANGLQRRIERMRSD